MSKSTSAGAFTSAFAFATKSLDAGELKDRLANAQAGALVTFEGWVRNHNEGKQVNKLEYEAFEELGLSEGAKIIAEAQEKFSILNASCVHRTGSLEIGEMAVWVGVVSAHRQAAFAACQYIIDEIKTRLPIWKKEHYADGNAEWVNCQSCSEQATSKKELAHNHQGRQRH